VARAKYGIGMMIEIKSKGSDSNTFGIIDSIMISKSGHSYVIEAGTVVKENDILAVYKRVASRGPVKRKSKAEINEGNS
jgi:hypothetical protein